MAIYHFSAKVISRAAGSSALASAAYRSASRLHDQRLDRHHDFSNKAGVVHSEVMLPAGAPGHLSDRERLWNEVEAGELRKDAQLSREIEFAIPCEMSREQGTALARDFVQAEFVDRGMVADLNVHWDFGADGAAKPHAHVMLTMREVGEDGFGVKVRDWNRTELLQRWREGWAAHANERMAELGIEARIDHRSHEEQGIALEPQHKIGPAGARRLERGEDAERAIDHQEIARRNGETIIAKPELGLDAITHQQSTFTVRDMAKLAHRHSDGKDQFDQVLGAMRGSDQIVALGKDGRGEDRFTSRTMLETELRMERGADALGRDAHAIADRHLNRAVAHANDNGLALSGEQRDALDHVVRGKDLSLIVGYAGSGKSAMLGVAREAWESHGYTVRGAALSGIATENLERGSGIQSHTIASLERQWARDRERLTARDVLVIDEAGMIGSRQMERVIGEVERAGAKLVLVGDVQQLQAIEAGAAFRALAERHGAIEITEVRRQQEGWQRDATRALATGRTPEALRAYEEHGMIRAAETREGARAALIAGWTAERQSDPARSQLILSHTRDEVGELNELARDALRQGGALASEIAVQTTRGERLFGAGDRIMFLRNERDLGVKNGTLGTVEQVSRTTMSVRLDDGRSVAFDLESYADIDHGYAATIHKSQGVTVDRVHVLATSGLDRHASYVALSRHREFVRMHYGRDDFDSSERLARVLSRERVKDTTLDYAGMRERFATQRGFERSPILDIIARERLVDRSHVHQQSGAPRQDIFAGIKVPARDAQAPLPTVRMFDTLDIGQAERRTPVNADAGLGHAVERYARAHQDIDRMTARSLPALDYQQRALDAAGKALDRILPDAHTDIAEAFARDPGVIADAAKGRSQAAIRAMQLEAEVRVNPELRADRFVQRWQALSTARGGLHGYDNETAHGRVEGEMKSLADGLKQDRALEGALAKRAGDLGLNKQWALEWRPGSKDGGIGHEMMEKLRGPSIGDQLIAGLGRGRGLGL